VFDHLKYYPEHEISPVRQDIENLQQHLKKIFGRELMYVSAINE